MLCSYEAEPGIIVNQAKYEDSTENTVRNYRIFLFFCEKTKNDTDFLKNNLYKNEKMCYNQDVLLCSRDENQRGHPTGEPI